VFEVDSIAHEKRLSVYEPLSPPPGKSPIRKVRICGRGRLLDYFNCVRLASSKKE
jgi:hypothetical protein